jgi:predicted dehydrogenase/GNAT superfamily N-acetyltransferase
MKLRVAVAGLEFGGHFAGALAAHPDVSAVGLCDVNPAQLAAVGKRLGISRLHADLREIIDSPDYDAVMLFTPIPQHAGQALAVLGSGKHCASAVPMATTLDDLRAIVQAQRATGLAYMMMETSLYTPEMFFVEDMLRRGELGRIQFLRGRFYHNLENHPGYWLGLPPMHYITHPISPILALAGTRAASVVCVGSGTMRRELVENQGNPFPIETALFGLVGSDAAVEVTSITFETAVQPRETFDVYGSRQSFTWSTFRDGQHTITRLHDAVPGGPKASPHTLLRFAPPPTHDRLPAALRPLGGLPHVHQVHEFIRSIIEGRAPRIDAVTAADWTAPGLCAHASAMAGGSRVEVPSFGEPLRHTRQLHMVLPPERFGSLGQVRLPEGYRLRQYRDEDLPAFIAVMEKAGFAGWTPQRVEQTRHGILPDGFFLVEHSPTGAVVATAEARHGSTEQHPGGAELGWVAADPAHKGKGLGLAVSLAATALMVQRGYRRVYLKTDDFRLPAIAVYLKLGYQPLMYAADMEGRWQSIMAKLSPRTP